MSRKEEIVQLYTELAEQSGTFPSKSDLLKRGVTRDHYRHYFGNMGGLKDAAMDASPEVFENISVKKESKHEHADFTREAIGSLIKENNYTEGVFVITAASPTSHLDWTPEQVKAAEKGEEVHGSNLHKEAFAAIQNYIERKKAQLVILPMPAHVKALKEQPRHYDPELKPFLENFATEYTFNNHLKAIEAYINPQQINPLTGLKRLRIHRYNHETNEPGQEIKRFKTSIIVAHSKQMMEVVPTGNNTHPRIIHSTGAITKPSYLRNRIGMIANEDHKIGALIVEIKDDIFYIRQVQMDATTGSFVDLGTRYHADGKITSERAEAFKMGDIHPGHHDEDALKAIYELWGIIKPKRIFFEDFFDGSSISHHLERKKISQALLPEYFTTLEKEIEHAKKTLYGIFKHAPKDAELIATASNHPEHVMRYLEEGRYLHDKPNFNISARMVVMALDGLNPLQEYLDPEKKMNWTVENQDYFVEGVQMNSHGHLGVNGTRGSKLGHELAHGNAMVAHSHTPSIYHDLFTVGHTTHERHGYNNGPSTWILCSGAVYQGAQKQLYMIVKGRAFANLKKKRIKKIKNETAL